MTQTLDTDYLVVGAGAMGMAFTDALVDHADVHVTLVDRRSAPGGHWLDAYPFVRLHQASSFYGVATTELGTGAVQTSGPEAGLHERAGADEIRAYYRSVLRRLVDWGGSRSSEVTSTRATVPIASPRRPRARPCPCGCAVASWTPRTCSPRSPPPRRRPSASPTTRPSWPSTRSPRCARCPSAS